MMLASKPNTAVKKFTTIITALLLSVGSIVVAPQAAQANIVTITYDPSGAAGYGPGSITYFSYTPIALPTPVNLVKPGYTFADWSTQPNGAGITYLAGVANGYTPTYSTTLYAKWRPNAQSIKFEKNDGEVLGTEPLEMTATTDSIISLPGPGSMSKAGHSFVGWRLSPIKGIFVDYPVGSTFRVTVGPIIFYANWDPHLFAINYDANGATSGAQPTNSSGFTGSVITLASNTGPNALARTGYIFKGWNTKADGTGSYYEAGSTGYRVPAGGVTLFADWTGHPQQINYNANGATFGVTPAQSSALTGASITVAPNTGPSALVKDGFIFGGWNTRADGNGVHYVAGSNIRVPFGGLNLFAVWDLSPKSHDGVIRTAPKTPQVLLQGVRVRPTVNVSNDYSKSEKTMEIKTSDARVSITTLGGRSTTQSNSTIYLSQNAKFVSKGSGFMTGSIVDVHALSTPRLIGTGVVDSSGNFSIDSLIPGDMALGKHTIQITANKIQGAFVVLVPLVVESPAKTIQTNTTITYFAYKSTTLSTAAKILLEELADNIVGKSVKSITISGFSGPTDRAFALSRARSVASYLRKLGVKVPISIVSRSTNLAGQEGRRAEIRVNY